MRRSVPILCALLLALPALAQEGFEASLGRFRAELADLARDLRLPGLSVAVVKNGQIAWAGGFGYADIEGGTPAGPDTRYMIASLTKPVAAVLALQLVERGRLDLDAAMHGYAPEIFPRDDVRIRHLLGHCVEGPGRRYQYRPDLYHHFGRALVAAGGKALEDLVIEGVLSKAGMRDTLPSLENWGKGEDTERLARPYAADRRGKLSRQPLPPGRLSTAYGLVSTVRDLARFDAALDDGRLLGASSLALMTEAGRTPRGWPLPTGLGWFVEEFAGERLVWGYGWLVKAYSGLVLKLPGRRLTLVVLANSDGLSAAYGLSWGSVLRSPVAAAFVRRFVSEELAGTRLDPPDWTLPETLFDFALAQGRKAAGGSILAHDLFARSYLEQAAGRSQPSQFHARRAVEYFPATSALRDAGNLFAFARSRDPVLRAAGERIARALLARDPDDPRLLFDLGILYSNTEDPATRRQAWPLLERVVAAGRGATGSAIYTWAAYLVARSYLETDPVRARHFAQAALATGYTGDGVHTRLEALLAAMGPAECWLAPLGARPAGR